MGITGLLGDLSPTVPRGDCPAVEVQLIFSHLLPVMTVFQESAVALAGGGEPSMQGNLEENSPAGHLFLPFCSQLLVHLTSPGSPNKPQCAAAAGAKAMTSPCWRLCFHCLSRGCWLYRGTWNPLCLCVPLNFQRNQACWEVPISLFPERILSDLEDFVQIPPFLKGMRIYQITNQTKKAIRTQV